MSKIRRGILKVNGTQVADVVNVDWNDAHEFDRRAVDDAMFGVPVEMKRSGSGSFELLAGNVESGYAAGDVEIEYTEVSVASGVETTSGKVATFTHVTFNSGGNIDNDAGPGSRRISFDYAESTTTDAA